MTNPTIEIFETLSPSQQELVLDAIENRLDAQGHETLNQLLIRFPELGREIAHQSQARLAARKLDAALPIEPDFSRRVFDALDEARSGSEFAGAESGTGPVQLQRMDPIRSPRFSLSPAGVRTLAAAAAVTIIAGLIFVYLQTNKNNHQLTPGPIASLDQLQRNHHDAVDPSEDSSVVPMTDPLIERKVVLAQQNWVEPEFPVPALEEAVDLLSRGRLIIRALAIDDTIARDGAAALDQGLTKNSTAWSIVGPATETLTKKIIHDRPMAPVMAFDAVSGTDIEIPRPELTRVWNARVETDARALASLVSSLESLGWRVRFEQVAEPIQLDPSLDEALWWDGAPSTWKPFEQVPVVLETLTR